MKMDPRLFLGCAAAAHLLWPVAAEDTLAMLQNSLRVNVHSGEAERKNQIGLLPDGNTVEELEKIVMARINEGVKGNSNFTKTINASIKQMMTGMISTTAANQQQIKLDIKAFKKCKTTMWGTYDRAIPVERDFWVLGEIYPKCIAAENALKLESDTSATKETSTKSSLKNSKKLLKAEGDRCSNVCTNQKNENYSEQLDRLAEYYTKCKTKIEPKWLKKEKLVKDYAKAEAAAKYSKAKYLAMLEKCKLIAYRMNVKKCDAVGMLKTSCSGYGTCWSSTKKVYDKDKKWIKKQEDEMKTEFRALVRIQCYLLVLDAKNDKENKKQLNICIGIRREDISTKPLDIDYMKIPKKPVCPKDPWCPCNRAYKNFYYKVGKKSRCQNNMVSKYTCAAC